MSEKPLSKFRRAVNTVSAFALLALIIAVGVAFDLLDLGWAAPFVIGILVLTLCLLNIHSDSAARTFRRLRLDLVVPSLKDMLAHQRELHVCRSVVHRMEHVLGFYNLWALLATDASAATAPRDGDTRKPSLGKRLADWLRWDTLNHLIQSDPIQARHALPGEYVQLLLDAQDEEDRIRCCAEQTAGFLAEQPKQAQDQPGETEPSLQGHEHLISTAQQRLSLLEARLWSPLLNLLYQDRYGPSPEDAWPDVQRGQGGISALVAVLLWSGKLPEPEEGLPYAAGRLETLIESLEGFTLDRARAGVLADQERRRTNRAVVERMKPILDYYNLYPLLEARNLAVRDKENLPTLSPDFYRTLIDELPECSEEDGRIRDCAQRIAGELAGSEPRVLDRHLVLLYQERHGRPGKAWELWQEERTDSDFTLDLASILAASQKLPQKDKDKAYTAKELKQLLGPLSSFSLDGVRKEILADQERRFENRSLVEKMAHTLHFYKLCEPAEAFWDELIGLLAGEQIAERRRDCTRRVAEACRGSVPPFSSELLELLYLERHESPSDVGILWETQKQQPGFIPALAVILDASQRLPSPESDLPYDAGVVTGLLQQLGDFSLDRVRAVVLADQDRRRENRYVVDRMKTTLKRYNLYPLLDESVLASENENGRLTFSPEYRRQLIDQPRGLKKEDARVRDCAYRIAGHLPASGLVTFVAEEIADGNLPVRDQETTDRLQGLEPDLLRDLLVLLYRKDYEPSTASLWRSWRVQRGFTLGLAVLLAHSGLLPSGDGYLPYGICDLERILDPFDDFELGRIRAEMNRLNEIWQLAQSYVQFLQENGIAGSKLEVPSMLDIVELPTASHALDAQTLEVLISIGKNAIGKAFPELPDLAKDSEAPTFRGTITRANSEEGKPLVYTLSLISLIIFITERTERLILRMPICFKAARQEKSAPIVFAYLEFRELLRSEDRLGGTRFVSVEYLIKNWAAKVQEKQAELERGLDKELRAIRDVLQDGDWLRRLPTLLDRTYEEILRQNQILLQEIRAQLDQRPSIRRPLEAVFKELSVETIGRYLESKKRIAYLITFRVKEGSLAYLLDCLASEDPKMMHRLREIGIDVYAEGQRKYNFKQYTNSARIGVVPEDWTFADFQMTFQSDFAAVVAANAQILPEGQLARRLDRLDDIELIVSRFDLAGKHYYWFRFEDLTKPRAIEKVREVFAGVLSPEELTLLIEYEGHERHERESIADAIMAMPIVELIGTQLRLRLVEREALELADRQLRSQLAAQQRCTNIQELGRVLHDDPRERWGAIDSLRRLLADVLKEASRERRTNIAQIYIETLAAAAGLINRASGQEWPHI